VTGAHLRSVATIAEMQGRDLGRRRIALTLLAGLPLAFYGALAGHDPAAIIPGGIAMAFALSGAAIFSVLSSLEVDQRLALAGFAPLELLAGRLIERGEAMSLRLSEGSSLLGERSSLFIIRFLRMNARGEVPAIAAPPRCSRQNRRRRPGPGSARPMADRAARARPPARCWLP